MKPISRYFNSCFTNDLDYLVTWSRMYSRIQYHTVYLEDQDAIYWELFRDLDWKIFDINLEIKKKIDA